MKTQLRIVFLAGALALTLASAYGAAFAGEAHLAPKVAQVTQVPA